MGSFVARIKHPAQSVPSLFVCTVIALLLSSQTTRTSSLTVRYQYRDFRLTFPTGYPAPDPHADFICTRYRHSRRTTS